MKQTILALLPIIGLLLFMMAGTILIGLFICEFLNVFPPDVFSC